jgi:hypothetical protein
MHLSIDCLHKRSISDYIRRNKNQSINNVLVYCHNRAAYVRRSPLRANSILFTISAISAPRRVIRKNPPSVQEGKRSLAMYAIYFRKHRRIDFLLLYPRLHYVAASCEHALRRRLSRVTLCPVNHFLYRSCVKSLL